MLRLKAIVIMKSNAIMNLYSNAYPGGYPGYALEYLIAKKKIKSKSKTLRLIEDAAPRLIEDAAPRLIEDTSLSAQIKIQDSSTNSGLATRRQMEEQLERSTRSTTICSSPWIIPTFWPHRSFTFLPRCDLRHPTRLLCASSSDGQRLAGLLQVIMLASRQ